jgi:transposase
MADTRFAWFAGIDWGSERHHACLVDSEGTIIAERECSHSGTGLAELADWLIRMTGAASEVVAAIEVPHGPVVDTLLDRGFAVYSINPKVLDRLRDRFSVAGAKDDQRDAYVLADGVRTDRRLFRRIQVSDPRFIELRAWSRLAEELQEERVRLSNRVHHQLWRYYPQMLKLSSDAAAPWLLELWTIAPTPNKGSQLRKSTVERLLKQHRIRRVTAEIVVGTLKEPAITVADGVAAAACAHMRSLVARLRLVNRELQESEHKLDELCSAVGEVDAVSGEGLQHRDVVILRSMPGIGRINLGVLLSEGSGLLKSRDYQGLRTLCGAAPVTRRSGKSQIVIMRYAAHARLRNAVYHWARVATQHDTKCRAGYAALRRRGHSHGRALRGIADRLLALACVLLQRQTLFDPRLRQSEGHRALFDAQAV